MKPKHIAFFLVVSLVCSPLLAQSSGGTGPLLEPEPVSFLSLFSALELDRVSTGILSEYGVHPVDFSPFNGSSTTTATANIHDIYYLLQGVSASTVDDLLIQPNPTAMMNSMSSTLSNTSRVPVAVVAYKYTKFRDDAISTGRLFYNAQNEIVEDVYDNNNQWIDPYNEQYLVAFAPYISVLSRSVEYDFSTLFRYTNQSIQSLQFDPGDGVFHSVTGTTYSHYYSTVGTKTMRLKITLTDNTYLYARSICEVIEAFIDSTVSCDETFVSEIASNGVYPTAYVDVLYAKGTETSFTKQPVVVAEGFDPITDPYGLLFSNLGVQPGKGCNDISTFTRYLPDSLLYNTDIVYINWNNSTASIESNANILKQVIEWVNDNNLTDNRIIVIGQSMGGLIARYALCTMESLGQEHNVSVYVSDDSPQLGANVPLGAIYAAQYLYDFLDGSSNSKPLIDNFSLNSAIGGNSLLTYIAEFLALRNSMSVRQMLKQYVDEDYEIDNSVFNNFQNTLHNLGFPQGDVHGRTLNLCLSNGGVNDYVTSSPLLDISIYGTHGDIIEYLLSSIVESLNLNSLNNFWHSLFRHSNATLEGHYSILPLSLPGAKVYELSLTHTTSFLWGGNPAVTPIESIIHYAPSAQIPLDIANGSYYEYNSPSFSNNLGGSYWSDFIISASCQDRFMFVPTVSSLCYKKGESVLVQSDYFTDFTTAGVNMDMIPFDGYRFFADTSSYHTKFSSSDFDWIRSFQNIAIIDTVLANGTRQFSLNNSNFTPVWSTSNPSIATINSSGQLTLHSYGSFYVYATINDSNSRLRLKQSITIPAPPFGGFPSYTLNSTDMTLEGVTTENVFRVTATPSTPIDSTLIPYIRYCWGRKEGTSTSITWVETTSLTHWFTIPVTDSRIVYFRVKYINQYSTTYSIACRIRPSIIIIDPLGQLYTEDMGDPFLQVKSNNDTFAVECLGEEVFFSSHEPSLAEICIEMLEKQVFKDTVKSLLPWGTEHEIIIPYSCTNLNEKETTNDVMVFIYREAME